MDAAYPFSPAAERGTLRRRAVAFLLALGANALLVMALLSLAPPIPGLGKTARKVGTFTLLPDADVESETERSDTKQRQAAQRASRARTAPLAPPPTPMPAAETAAPFNVLVLSRADLAATDRALRAAPGAAPPAETGGEDPGAQTAGSATAAAGARGPGGERLYDAEWYVRPTHAELAFYVPAGAPRTGWGMIACRTVADYRVDDCVELGQSPTGSGLAGAVRRAAWQFRVMPPRIGHKRMIGAWVRIRIDYTERGGG